MASTKSRSAVPPVPPASHQPPLLPCGDMKMVLSFASASRPLWAWLIAVPLAVPKAPWNVKIVRYGCLLS